jgi:hypothetical protein
MLETRKAWTDYLKGKGSRQTAVDALQKAEKQPWFELAFLPKASKLTTDPEHNSWRKEMDEDAVAAVRKVKRFPLSRCASAIQIVRPLESFNRRSITL